jgi:hypothetical protein
MSRRIRASGIPPVADLNDEDQQRMILKVSRMLDDYRSWVATQEIDWDPLHDALPMKHCNGFMWMYRVEWEGSVIEVYKHGITRRSLHLDHDGRAYLYRRDGYLEIPVKEAVDRVFEDLEEWGLSRETPYTEEYRREKYRKAREHGWTVIT